MPVPIGFDPSVINQAAVSPYTLGQEVEYNGKLYRCLKLADAVAGVSGMVAEAASGTDGNIVTVDRAGGSSLGRVPVAVLVGPVTAGYYFFGLIRGMHAGVKDAAGGLNTVSLKVTSHATTDGDAAPATVYTDNIIGVVRVVSAAGVAGVHVQVGA